MSPISGDHLVVDARGLFCPVPIIRASEAIRNLSSGSVLEIISDDPAIEMDLPAWCRSNRHQITALTREGRDWHYFVEKA